MKITHNRPVHAQDTDKFSDAYLCNLLQIDHEELQYAIQSLNALGHKAPKYEENQDVAGTIFSIAGLNPATCSGIELGIKIGLIIAKTREVTEKLLN